MMEHIIFSFYIISFGIGVGALMLGRFFYSKIKSKALKYLLLLDSFFLVFLAIDIASYYKEINNLYYTLEAYIIIITALLISSWVMMIFATKLLMHIIQKQLTKNMRISFIILCILSMGILIVIYIGIYQGELDSKIGIHSAYFVSNIFCAIIVFYDIIIVYMNKKEIIKTLKKTMLKGINIISVIMIASVIFNLLAYIYGSFWLAPLSPFVFFIINSMIIKFAYQVSLNDISFQIVTEDLGISKYDRYLKEHGTTEREKEIIALVLEGCTNTEIGEILAISPYTVRNHISNVYKKLYVKNRYELIGLLVVLQESVV